MNHNKKYIKETYPDLITDPYSDYGQGWVPHVNKITDTLVENINTYNDTNGTDVKLEIQQIKSKFGGLRYYFALRNVEDLASDDYQALAKHLQDYVHAMESVCSFICEKCGMYGEQRRMGWTYTLCDDCHGEQKREDED